MRLNGGRWKAGLCHALATIDFVIHHVKKPKIFIHARSSDGMVLKTEWVITISIIVGVLGLLVVYLSIEDNTLDESEYSYSGSRGKIDPVQWEPNGNRIAMINDWNEREGPGEEHQLIIWNYSSKRIERVFDDTDGFYYLESLSWSPDGSMLAVGCVDVTNSSDDNLPWVYYAEPRIRIINTTSWEIISTLDDNFSFITTLDWSWDGKFLGGADLSFAPYSCNLLIWETEEWNSIVRLREPAIGSIQWNPIKYSLAAGHRNGNMTIYNATGFPLRIVQAHEKGIEAIAWNPNGTLVASGSNAEIALWETRFWTRVENISLDEDWYGRLNDIDWNMDGSRLAVCWYDYIYVLTSPSLQKEKHIHGHNEEVTSISWSHHNNLIVSGSYDERAIIWKV